MALPKDVFKLSLVFKPCLIKKKKKESAIFREEQEL